MNGLLFERRDLPGVTWLTLRGEADLSSSRRLRHELEAVEAERLVVDLRELTFCDSTCLAALAFAARRQLERGRRIALQDPQPHIVDLLDRLALLDLFGLHRPPARPEAPPPTRSTT
jgi:anti-sigma B factor antagonist